MEKINKNIVIAALARNCAKQLPNNISNIEELRNRFAWSQVVVVENDSKDDTKKILKNWSEKYDNVKIISQDFGIETIPGGKPSYQTNVSFCRINNMVNYRNIYMDYINILDHMIDYLIVIDLDIESFSVEGVIKSITNVNNDWGGIFANGVTKKSIFGFTFSKLFYDTYAIYEYPFQDRIGFTEEMFDSIKKNIGRKINNLQYYSVISAFGGVGIYKYDVVRNLRYRVVENFRYKNQAICEHVIFNMDIVKMGLKNYISRELRVVYGGHSLGAIIKNTVSAESFDFMYSIFIKMRKYFRHIFFAKDEQ